MCERQVAAKRVLALSKNPGLSGTFVLRRSTKDIDEQRGKCILQTSASNLHSSGVCKSRRTMDRGGLDRSTVQGSRYPSEEIPQ
jgi:hypothetical protein